MRRRFPVLAATALLAACGAEVFEAPQVGSPMPSFSLASVTGDQVSLGDFDGKVVLINLWATWCPPCRSETPLLQSMHDQLASRGFEVVGISVDQPAARAAVDEFLAEYEVSYTQLLDPTMATMDRYGVIGLPASYLVGSDGVVRAVRLGPIVEGDAGFESALEEALSEREVAGTAQ